MGVHSHSECPSLLISSLFLIICCLLPECLSLLTSASAIFSFILLCGVVLLVGFFNLEYYTVVPSIACSKIALLGQVLHPRQFVHSLVHCIMGVVVAWCCAFTIGGRYRALGHPCTQDER
uniref:Nucleoporin NDC1 n=1 Tax=Hucho hucho TaxID=62062 RepID=A0A4W5Q1M8_9TELE